MQSGGGGGVVVVAAFSSLARISGEGFHDSFPACAFVVWWWWLLFPRLPGFWGKVSMIHSFKWRSARTHQFHFLGQDQSTVAQQAETTVAECSLMSCM